MTDIIHIQGKDESLFEILASMPDKSLRELRDTIDDIADFIEREAIRRAPEGEEETDDIPLKEQAVIRRDFKRRVRTPDGLVMKVEMEIPEGKPRWVHNGTGLYGPLKRLIRPRTAPFMVFQIRGQQFRLKTVRGQRAQPYLDEAFDRAEATYIPVKLAELRAELDTLL